MLNVIAIISDVEYRRYHLSRLAHHTDTLTSRPREMSSQALSLMWGFLACRPFSCATWTRLRLPFLTRGAHPLMAFVPKLSILSCSSRLRTSLARIVFKIFISSVERPSGLARAFSWTLASDSAVAGVAEASPLIAVAAASSGLVASAALIFLLTS